jgi:hypothetical protein
MSVRIGRPSPAMVVACIALIVALGGTGYAATQLPPKSVGQKQLRNGSVGNLQLRDKAVTAGKLHKDAVTGNAIQNGAVKSADLAKGILPAAASSAHQVSGDPIAPGAVGAATASCDPGQRATGGGGGFAGPAVTNDKMVDSIPVGDERPIVRWRVSLFNGGTQPRTPVAYVLCVAP